MLGDAALIDRLTILVADSKRLAPQETIDRPTFMELSGYPHYENVCSNILKFFLDPSRPHGLGRLCLDSLQALFEPKRAEPLSNIEVEREALTDNGNRVDLLITSDTHVIVIENKIFAGVTNPFEDYHKFIDGKTAETDLAKPKQAVKLLLSLHPCADTSHGFKNILYTDFIKSIRSQLGQYTRSADSRYLIYLLDFLNTLENLKRETKMDAAWLIFFSERGKDVQDLMVEAKKLIDDMRQRVQQLHDIIEPAIDRTKNPNIPAGKFYRNQTEEPFRDVLYYDIVVGPDLPVAIATYISPNGWEIQFFVRNGGNKAKLKDLLNQLQIPFEQREDERFIHAKRFPYQDVENVKSELQSILEMLAGRSLGRNQTIGV